MAPNARENKDNKPAQPDPNNFRIARVRPTARRGRGSPRKTAARVDTRAIRQLVIETERREREQEAQQEEVIHVQCRLIPMETTETRETTAAQVP